MSEEQRLLHDLFQNYSKYARPALDRDDQVVVTFRAKLKQIIDLVSKAQWKLYITVINGNDESRHLV